MGSYNSFIMILVCQVLGSALKDSNSSSERIDLYVYTYSPESSNPPEEIQNYLQRFLSWYGYVHYYEGTISQDPLEICSSYYGKTPALTLVLVENSETDILPCEDTDRLVVYYNPSEPLKFAELLLNHLQHRVLRRDLETSDCPNGMIQDPVSQDCVCEDSSQSIETLCECPISSDSYYYIVNCDLQETKTADCHVKESYCEGDNGIFFCESGYSLKGSDCLICTKDIQYCDHCPTVLGPNLIKNGNFEEPIPIPPAVFSINEWLATDNSPSISNTCISGLQCLEGWGTINQTIDGIDPTAEYVLSFWVLLGYLEDSINIDIGAYSIAIYDRITINNWKQFKITGISGLSSSESLTINLTNAGVFFDDVQFQQVEDVACNSCFENFELIGNECVCDESQGTKKIDGELCTMCERWIVSQDLSFYFAENYVSLVLDFSIAVDQNGVTCETLFDTPVLGKFGNQYSCKFVNEKRFEIELGENFTIRNENISIREGVLIGNLSECGVYVKAEIDVNIQYIFPFPKPTANILAPSAVNFGCEDLNIDGSKSQGKLKHSLLYNWTIQSDPENLSLTSFSSQIHDTKASLEISRVFLLDGEITVTLSVMNYLGETSEKSQIISASEQNYVSILLDGSVLYEFKATSTVTYSIGSVTSCRDDIDYEISWSLISDSTGIDLAKLWAAQTSQWTLVIPSQTFSPFTQPEFEISVEGFSNTETLTVSVVAENPVIVADRSSGPFSINEDLRIDASNSYDPNESKPLTFEWTCAVDGSNCSSYIDDSTSSALLVQENLLSEGKFYTFTLKCSLSSVSSTRTFTMEGVNYGVPSGNMHFYNSILLPSTLSAYERTRIQLDVAGTYTYRWYTKNRVHFFQGSTIDSSVILEENTLEPGQEYKLAVAASNTTSYYEFIYDYYINLPPAAGYFTSTKEGIEYTTVFEMNADEWVDPEGLDYLFYSFGYTANGVDFFMSIKNQSSTYYALLPSSATVVWVEVHDEYDITRRTLGVNVAKSLDFDLDSFIHSKESEIRSENTKHTDLPYILNDLNVQEIEEETVSQEVFDLVNDGVEILIYKIPEYTQNAVITILNIIENSVRTSTLMTDDNILRISENILLLLNRSYSDIGMPIRVLKEYQSTLSASIFPDYEFVYNANKIIDIVYSTLSEILKLTSLDILEHELLELTSPNIEVQEFLSDTQSISNSLFELPSGFEITFPKLPESVQDYYFVIAAAINPLETGDESIPFLIDFTLYDKYSLKKADLVWPSNITIEIPIYEIEWSLTAENSECVFLNTDTLTWEVTGCYLISLNWSTITCACNHLTVFTAGDFLEEGENTLRESNISDPYNLDVLATADEFSLIGFYFSGSLMITYAVCFQIARRFDKNDIKVRSEESKGLRRQTTTFPEIESQTETKSIYQVLIEKHHMISPFTHFNPEYPRIYRLSLCFVTCFGKIFILGLFYQIDDDNRDIDSLQKAIVNYDYRDIWKIIYSVILMVPISEIISFLLSSKNQNKCTRIKNSSGMTISIIFMLFSTWNITGFVIGFNINETYLWLLSALFSLLFGLSIAETVKIILFEYVIKGGFKYFTNRKRNKEIRKEKLPILIRNIIFKRLFEAITNLESLKPQIIQEGELELIRLK